MTDVPSSRAEDAALVAAVRGGDPASWGTIFDRHRDAVWRLGFGIVRRPSDADDVVQATFLKAVESLDQLRDPAALRPWQQRLQGSEVEENTSDDDDDNDEHNNDNDNNHSSTNAAAT